MASSEPTKEANVSVGANPVATFPNTHLNMAGRPGGNEGSGGVWSSPQPMPTNASALSQLRDAVAAEDWARAFSESKTKIQAEAKWSATEDRCAVLQCLCTLHKAKHVLEIGSFCGVAALAMAEAIPKDGQVVALELEPFFVEFGKSFRQRSKAGAKIDIRVGPAVESLKDLVAEAVDGDRNAFDFVVIDGDKSSMAEYLQYVRSQYFLSPNAIVCMDVTPFKGQAPTRFKKFGAEDQWKTNSGEEEIAMLRKLVDQMPDHISHEFGGLLVIQRRPEEFVEGAEGTEADRDDDDDDQPDADRD